VNALSFRHSGKLGDIIYSLPAVRALGGGDFFVDYETEYSEKPALGKAAALQMVDLLRTQVYIRLAKLYDGGPVSYNLDAFRKQAMPIHLFNLIKNGWDELAGQVLGSGVKGFRQQMLPALQVDLPQLHWEALGVPGQIDTSTPWITGITKRSVADVVVCRTARHRGKFNWLRLRDYAAKCVFVGLEEEWHAFSHDYFKIDFYRVEDLVDFARVVAGARLFVGNQSFGLALADAMLMPRAVELWEPSPNRLTLTNAHNALTHKVISSYLDR